VAFNVNGSEERLVKSFERVRDLGEVFTPNATVQQMLDLLPSAMWAPHPSPTFFEPACGDGNFLVAILDRKSTAFPKTSPKSSLRRVFGLNLCSSTRSSTCIDLRSGHLEGQHHRRNTGS